MYYANLYIFGSMLGYIHETILKLLFFPSINNGLLYGPWIPIYGIGFVLIVYCSRKIGLLKKSKLIKTIILFFLLAFSLMFLEEVGGVLIEFLFHRIFWNYSKLPFHIGPYISLEICFIWGVLSLMIIFYLEPFLELFLKKIPIMISIGILFLQLIDFLLLFF